MKPDNVICEFLGGSHLYGLNTPSSDEDVRGIFVNTEPAYILGTRRFDEARKQNPDIKEDVVYKELSHFMRLLNQANTEALELLFAPIENFTSYSDQFERIQSKRNNLIDSKRLFNCLRGYMQGEYRLAVGQRTGQLGGKRYEQVQKYGFSPKNFTQLFRLAYVGRTFFTENRFVVNVRNEPIYEKLMAIKTQPEKFSKESLTQDFEEAEKALVQAFERRAVTHHFEEEVANDILVEIYHPYITARYQIVRKGGHCLL